MLKVEKNTLSLALCNVTIIFDRDYIQKNIANMQGCKPTIKKWRQAIHN